MTKSKKKQNPANDRHGKSEKRPPIVAVMGHIDHGKSSLLDAIRKTNTTEGEAGGITQHISAYEATHTKDDGTEERLTFIDTPGHEAFDGARSRGATVADIAILVVAADDGVNTQTRQALKFIEESATPYVVAITKVDKNDGSVESAKSSLVEAGVYLEGYGGDVSYAEVSSKTGDGIGDLLETILLVAEIQELEATLDQPARGVVLEASVEPQKGTSATLLVRDGTLQRGQFVVAESAYSPVRIMEDFRGNTISQATPSMPVKIIGFNELPEAGALFSTASKKKDAEAAATQNQKNAEDEPAPEDSPADLLAQLDAPEKVTIPIVVKADTAGSQDGIAREIEKLDEKFEHVELNVIRSGVGEITERDVLSGASSENAIVVAFGVKLPTKIQPLLERHELPARSFHVIYEMSEWLEARIDERRPRVETEEVVASAKIKRVFSQSKNSVIAGGKVTEGTLRSEGKVNIYRRENNIGTGKILELKQGPTPVNQIEEGNEFGIRIETKVELAGGDVIEAFVVREK